MKLTVGQTISVEGMEAKVTGMMKLHTYTKYRLKTKAGILWLDDCGSGRLWKKTSAPVGIRADMAWILGHPAEGIFAVVDKSLDRVADSIVRAVGCESVFKVSGRVEGTKKGDKVFYVEGEFLKMKRGDEFDLFIIEVWGYEPPEFSVGKLVSFFK